MATKAILHKLEHIMTLLVYTRTIRRTRAHNTDGYRVVSFIVQMWNALQLLRQLQHTNEAEQIFIKKVAKW